MPAHSNPRTVLLLALLWLAHPGPARAERFLLPPPGADLIGEIRVVRARHEDTLVDIARRYDVGFDEIVRANPGVDRWLPGEGTTVVLPTRHVLPDAPREGLVLNLPEMRLYYFPEAAEGEPPVVDTHPVSIGRMDWETPLGVTKIVAKQEDPPWYPPESIKAEHAADGEILPDMVPGGPDNPLGRFALRLGVPGYLIHGTNRPFGIGMRVTHGCVRMYPEDIEALFRRVPVGTPVHVVNQPVKAGWWADRLYIEVHVPLEEDGLDGAARLQQAAEAVRLAGGPEDPDLETLALVVENAGGLPVPAVE